MTGVSDVPEWKLPNDYTGRDNGPIWRRIRRAEQEVQRFLAWVRPYLVRLGEADVLAEVLGQLATLQTDWVRLEPSPDEQFIGTPALYPLELCLVLDQKNEAVEEIAGQVRDRLAAMQQSLKIVTEAIGALDDETQARILADERFGPYNYWLRQTFARAHHSLPWGVAPAMQVAGEQLRVLGRIRASTSLAKIEPLLASPDRTVRLEAAAGTGAILKGLAGPAAGSLNLALGAWKREASQRQFPTSFEMQVTAGGLEVSEAELVLGTIAGNYDLVRRYYELIEALLGLTRKGLKLSYWERNVTLGDSPKFIWAKVEALLMKVFGDIHPRLAVEFRRALDEERVDATCGDNKRPGAATWRSNGGLASYFSVCFTGSLNEIPLIGHELGHVLAHALMAERLGAMQNDPTQTLAELAGMAIEFIAVRRMPAHMGLDSATRLNLLMLGLNRRIGGIFRQAGGINIERALHSEYARHGDLSVETINRFFLEGVQQYTGGGLTLEHGAEYGWVPWAHLWQGFYNLSYPVAGLIGGALAKEVEEDPAAMAKVMRLMAAGSRGSLTDTLAKAGVELTPAFLTAGMQQISAMLDEATALAHKLGYGVA